MPSLFEVGPIVGAEGTYGKTIGALEIAFGVICPSVTDGYGMGYVWRFHQDTLHETLSFSVGFGNVPFVVGTCYGETLDISIFSQRFAALSGTEGEDTFTFADAHTRELRSCTSIVAAIGAVQSQQRQSMPHLLLVLRVDVVGLANVDVHGHAYSVQQQRLALSLADGCPFRLRLQVVALQVVGNLHEIEG